MKAEQVSALRDIWQGIQDADKAVLRFLEAGGDAKIAIAAMRHPMKGFQGIVEGAIFDLDPDALDTLRESGDE